MTRLNFFGSTQTTHQYIASSSTYKTYQNSLPDSLWESGGTPANCVALVQMQSIADPLLAAAIRCSHQQKQIKAPHLTVSATVFQMACLLQNITGRNKKSNASSNRVRPKSPNEDKRGIWGMYDHGCCDNELLKIFNISARGYQNPAWHLAFCLLNLRVIHSFIPLRSLMYSRILKDAYIALSFHCSELRYPD